MRLQPRLTVRAHCAMESARTGQGKLEIIGRGHHPAVEAENDDDDDEQ